LDELGEAGPRGRFIRVLLRGACHQSGQRGTGLAAGQPPRMRRLQPVVIPPPHLSEVARVAAEDRLSAAPAGVPLGIGLQEDRSARRSLRLRHRRVPIAGARAGTSDLGARQVLQQPSGPDEDTGAGRKLRKDGLRHRGGCAEVGRCRGPQRTLVNDLDAHRHHQLHVARSRRSGRVSVGTVAELDFPRRLLSA